MPVSPTNSADALPILSLRGVTKRFGAVQALSEVDLDVPPGQVTALCGDNGAGKSVLIKTVAGLWEPDAGQILWEGKPVRIRTPKEAEALGIVTIYQDLALCDNLDVVQNMYLGHEPLEHGLLDEGKMEVGTRRTLQDLSVASIHYPHQAVGRLSGGPASVGRRGPGGHGQGQAGDHGRADGGDSASPRRGWCWA
ncbi:MAG TPA: ATP-binding cassette domain-containing protein [Solirubrobacteraceae bacterium]|nr:ATP-binding cassette domain-containing protein [Solirubrobacteraceae bacterium]